MFHPNKKAGGSQILRTQEDVVAENTKKTFDLPDVNLVWLFGREAERGSVCSLLYRPLLTKRLFDWVVLGVRSLCARLTVYLMAIKFRP